MSAIFKPNSLLLLCLSLCFGTFILVLIAFYDSNVHRGAPLFHSVNRREQGAVYPYENLKILVMVAGNSVYTGGSNFHKGEGEEAWYLESYQKHPGQAATFVDHIKIGIERVAVDEEALLLFSGGETRKDTGPRSEAQSYWNVADTHQWFGKFFLGAA
ncbi:hypothetical protein KI387_016317, partial [Taxus chinensis]